MKKGEPSTHAADAQERVPPAPVRGLKKCPRCGCMFKPAKRRQKYCSRACANRSRSSARKPTVCPTCGKTFMPPANHPHTRFCSRRCSVRALADSWQTSTCQWCGREFKPAVAKQKFCSNQCRFAANYHARRGTVRAAQAGVSGQVDEEKVRAYLSLPPAERYARRDELTKAEHKIAQRLYAEAHASRCVAVNW